MPEARVPILGEDGLIDPDQLPAATPDDGAVAALVAEPTSATQAAVLALIGSGAVTVEELTAALAGYATSADLVGLATESMLDAKAPRLPYDVVVYTPAAGWANPDPGPGRWREFDSVLYVEAPSPPSRTGVNGDRWKAHPQSPARKGTQA